MQPNEKLTVEERIAEIEEANMLLLAILTGEPADATQEERLKAQIRLAYLMERMRDRMLHRDLRKGEYQAPPGKTVVTEDAEL